MPTKIIQNPKIASTPLCPVQGLELLAINNATVTTIETKKKGLIPIDMLALRADRKKGIKAILLLLLIENDLNNKAKDNTANEEEVALICIKPPGKTENK